MADTTDLDIVVTMDMDIFGDVRRGRLKPNPLPNLLRIPTSTTDMDMDSAMVDTMDMALDTIGENKSTKPIINILPQSAFMETMTTLAFGAGLILYKFPCVKFD